jgi:hypothetical protein
MRWGIGILVAVAALTVAPLASADERVVSATGVAKVSGLDAVVEVLVVVPEGADAAVAKRRALAVQGARPNGAEPQSSAFAFSGLRWNVLPVVQYYNPSAQPVVGHDDLTATQSKWSNVSGSSYRISNGGATTRCPSLVKECPGAQRFDSRNDVGWNRLSGNTLGVTWYSTSIDEADMALNYRFAWTDACRTVSGRYDAQTVFLHENGHVAGLDHSNNRSAVMYPSYQGVRCNLSADDRAGIAALY